MTDSEIFATVQRRIKAQDYLSAEALLLKTMKERKDKPVWLNLLADLYYRANLLDRAYEAAEISYNLDPHRADTLQILSAVTGTQGKLNEQLDWALRTVALMPKSYTAFNNLGTALFSMGMFEEALIPFETAIDLNPMLLETKINIGIIHNKAGRHAESVRVLEATRKQVSGNRELKDAIDFYLSLEYLALGDLERGWPNYDGGFSTRLPPGSGRNPARKFNVPRWKGQSIIGKRLLVWREQGIGDELLFMSCYGDLAREGAHIIIECEHRLVAILSKTFPDFEVREQRFGMPPKYLSPVEDFDYEIPAGSLPRIYRKSIKDFPVSAPKLYIDPARKAYFEARFGTKRDQKLIGICWRSGKIDPIRRASYTDINAWEMLLKREGYRFVCLQYDDCDEELAVVKQQYGIDVIKLPGIDLKNNFIDVAALISCLDAVISVGTAVVPLAGAVGARTYMLTEDTSWTLLAADYPWYESVIPISVAEGRSMGDAIAQLPSQLI
jgi:tetratricopeptide (TPR) repeat protein